MEISRTCLAPCSWLTSPSRVDPKIHTIGKRAAGYSCCLERWQEALQELLLAHQGMQSSPTTHEALMETYTHLGMTELAAEHRKQLIR